MFAIKKMLSVVALVAICAGASQAMAAGTGTGKIKPGWYSYAPGGIVFFWLDGPNGHASSPCTAIPDRWAIDTTTQDGKLAFSIFMLAYATDRTVTVNGHDNVECIHGNTEQASEIFIS